jgi:hypothetical protein
MGTMKNFRLTIARDGSAVALITRDAGQQDGPEQVSVYGADRLYPLAAQRYHKDLPNLFVDVLDTIDGHGPQPTADGKEKAALSYPAVTVRTLARRATRAVSDGSGTVNERFDDAGALWQKMQQHAVASVVRTQDAPILEVRKNHNWRKNQPLADVRADPQAWYVTDAFSRSNKAKDALHAYRGLTAVLDAVSLDGDDEGSGAASAQQAQELRKAVLGNLDYPTYRQVAALLADSNMLVFHSDADLASWIRHEAGQKEGCLESGTPVILCLRSSRGAQIVPGDTHNGSDADLDGLHSGDSLAVSALANRLAPRKTTGGTRSSGKASGTSRRRSRR